MKAIDLGLPVVINNSVKKENVLSSLIQSMCNIFGGWERRERRRDLDKEKRGWERLDRIEKDRNEERLAGKRKASERREERRKK